MTIILHPSNDVPITGWMEYSPIERIPVADEDSIAV